MKFDYLQICLLCGKMILSEKKEKDASGEEVTVVEETTKTEYSYSAPEFEHLMDTTAGTGNTSTTTAGTAITSETKFESFNGTDSFFLLNALNNNDKIDTEGQKRTGALTTVDYMKGKDASDLGNKTALNTRGKISEADYDAANEIFTSALMNGTDHIYTDTFTITANLGGFTSADDAASSLPVDVRIVMNGQGNIKAYFKNHVEASAKKQRLFCSDG